MATQKYRAHCLWHLRDANGVLDTTSTYLLYLYEKGGTTTSVTLYSSATDATGASNVSISNGSFDFWVEPGMYTVQVKDGTTTVFEANDVQVDATMAANRPPKLDTDHVYRPDGGTDAEDATAINLAVPTDVHHPNIAWHRFSLQSGKGTVYAARTPELSVVNDATSSGGKVGDLKLYSHETASVPDALATTWSTSGAYKVQYLQMDSSNTNSPPYAGLVAEAAAVKGPVIYQGGGSWPTFWLNEACVCSVLNIHVPSQGGTGYSLGTAFSAQADNGYPFIPSHAVPLAFMYYQASGAPTNAEFKVSFVTAGQTKVFYPWQHTAAPTRVVASSTTDNAWFSTSATTSTKIDLWDEMMRQMGTQYSVAYVKPEQTAGTLVGNSSDFTISIVYVVPLMPGSFSFGFRT